MGACDRLMRLGRGDLKSGSINLTALLSRTATAAIGADPHVDITDAARISVSLWRHAGHLRRRHSRDDEMRVRFPVSAGYVSTR